MKRTRRKFTAAFKTKVVIDALKERDSLAALSSRYKVLPAVITNGRKNFLNLPLMYLRTNKELMNRPRM
jgi:transposase